MSTLERIQAGSLVPIRIHVYNELVDPLELFSPSGGVKVTITDSAGTATVSLGTMTAASTGVFTYAWQSATNAVLGDYLVEFKAVDTTGTTYTPKTVGFVLVDEEGVATTPAALVGINADYLLGYTWDTAPFIQDAAGAVGRTIQAKLREIYVSPEDFGAVGDGNTTTYTGTDDASAWNAMLAWIKTQVQNATFGDPQFYTVAIFCRPGAVYRIASPLNFTDIACAGYGLQVFGNGATIYSMNLNNVPMICAVGSLGIRWHDLSLYAENGSTSGAGNIRPSYGLVIGRKGNEDASGTYLDNVRITGWFNRSAHLNIGSEICTYMKPFILNSMDASGGVYSGFAMHFDPARISGYVSPFATMGTPYAFGMNDQYIIQGKIHSAQAAAIRIDSPTAGVKFVNTYLTVPSGQPAICSFGAIHRDLDLDVHVEVTGATYVLLIDLSVAATYYNLQMSDHQTQAAYLIGTVNRVGAGTIINGEIRAGSAQDNATRIFEPSSTLDYQGAIHIGTNQAGLNNLSGASAIRGEVYTAASAATIQANFPATGWAWIHSTAETSVVAHGTVGFGGAHDATYGKVKLVGPGYQAIAVRSSDGSGAVGVLAANAAAAVRLGSISNHPVEFMVNNTPRATLSAEALTLTGFVDMPEIPNTGSPASNIGRLYFRDNGAGKTQLVVLFPTGAAQVIATET